MKNLGWALRMMATIGCAGCGAYTVTATGGTIYQQSATLLDPMSSALRASASRDLPCESNALVVTRLDPEREYAVTGCGVRAVYRALTPSLTSKRLQLVARSPLPLQGGNVALLGTRHAGSDHSAP